jgi:hypothetical protein
MGKILEAIEKHFPEGETFHPYELSIKTGIDTKVCAMNLKKLSNTYRIGYLSDINVYWNWGVEECNRQRILHNELIDKYNLKMVKLKPL